MLILICLFSLFTNLLHSYKTTPFIRTINNIDLNKIGKSDIQELKNFFEVNPVLVFKNQNLTPQKHYEICKIFDNNFTDRIAHPFNETIVPDCPQLALRGKGTIKNIWKIKNKKIRNAPNFFYNPLWHQDLVGSNDFNPTVVSSMYMIESPKKGGETLFANLETGYINFKKKYNIKKFGNLKCKYSTILSLYAKIDYSGYGRLDKYWELYKNGDDNFKKLIEDTFIEQPFIIKPCIHSEKKALMISPNKLYNFFDNVNNINYSPSESQELMREILNSCVFLENNIEKVEYEKNDLVIFNNRKVIHSSTPTYEIEGNRIMSLLFLDTNETIHV